MTSKRRHYHRLLNYLYGVEFTYTIELDGNRAEDGVDLRHRFAYETEYTDDDVQRTFDDNQCNLLEMMVALSIRCEEHIMINEDIGDRTNIWFWGMIDNSQLGELSDMEFNSEEAEMITNRILNRTYGPNGEYGLFYIKNPPEDLRTVDIWYQLSLYLNQYVEEMNDDEYEYDQGREC